jgi:hypothetical protein
MRIIGETIAFLFSILLAVGLLYAIIFTGAHIFKIFETI